MYRIRNIQEKITELKKETDTYILAHSYQSREIVEIADFTGDSYSLSVQAADVTNKNVIMCGVRFMAETVKMLSPEKKVFLANAVAGCPMAEQIDKEMLSYLKTQHPEFTIVCYINTTAELKTLCDVCVTSSSAVKIISNIDNKNIIFIPDCNLGAYIADKLPDKNIKLLQGGCPIHAAVNIEDVVAARIAYQNALLLVHPECVPAVVKEADFVGSTSQIMDYAKASPAREFIIGTELSIAEHLQYECPQKQFFYLSKKLLCPNMKATTLIDVLNCMTGSGGEEIILDEMTIVKGKKCIDEMIKLGNK